MVCRRRSKGRCWNGNAKLYRSVSKNKRVKIRTNFRQCGKRRAEMKRVGEKSRREKEPEERRYRCANLKKVAKQCVFPIIIFWSREEILQLPRQITHWTQTLSLLHWDYTGIFPAVLNTALWLWPWVRCSAEFQLTREHCRCGWEGWGEFHSTQRLLLAVMATRIGVGMRLNPVNNALPWRGINEIASMTYLPKPIEWYLCYHPGLPCACTDWKQHMPMMGEVWCSMCNIFCYAFATKC